MIRRLFSRLRGRPAAAPLPPASKARSVTIGVPELSTMLDESISGQFAATLGTLGSSKERVALRKYVRQGLRDNPILCRYRTLVLENVIGPDGLTLQSTPDVAGSVRRATLGKDIEAAWYRAGERIGLRGESLNSIKGDFAVSYFLLGEAFCEVIETRQGIRLQPIPPELVDEDYSATLPSGAVVRNGVEIDAQGRDVAFWVMKRVATDYGTTVPVAQRERRRIPVSDMLYAFRDREYGQTRARPPVSAALLRLLLINKLQESLVHLHMVAAGAGGFIEQDSGVEDAPPTFDRTIQSGSTTMPVLDPGQRVAAFVPATPTPQYQNLYDTAVREVAASFRVSYVALTGNVSDANYSSQRISLLSDRDFWRVAHSWITADFLTPLFPRVIRAEVERGRLLVPLQALQDDSWLSHTFHGRPFDWIDPEKEAKAIEIALNNHLTTMTREYNRRGLDFTAAMDERAAELAYMRDKLGDDAVRAPASNAPAPSLGVA